MGTNYYIRQKATEQEKETLRKFNAKLPEIHVGKSSGGWSFSFHSPSREDLQNFGIAKGEVVSYAQWIDVLEETDRFELFDEYDQEVSIKTFKELVESKKDGLNHTTECLNSSREHEREHARRSCFLDPQGHSFSTGDFS